VGGLRSQRARSVLRQGRETRVESNLRAFWLCGTGTGVRRGRVSRGPVLAKGTPRLWFTLTNSRTAWRPAPSGGGLKLPADKKRGLPASRSSKDKKKGWMIRYMIWRPGKTEGLGMGSVNIDRSSSKVVKQLRGGRCPPWHKPLERSRKKEGHE